MIEYVVNSTSICTCPRLKRIFLEVLLWKEDASSKLLSSTRQNNVPKLEKLKINKLLWMAIYFCMSNWIIHVYL